MQAVIDELMQYVQNGDIILDDIITHRMSLDEVAKGYEIFDKKEDNCVKVVLDPWN